MSDIIDKGRQLAESYNREGNGFANTGKKNAYVCKSCGSYIVTIDRHPGVTPFMVKCGACKEFAQSKVYRVQDYLEPTHEWYRPDTLAGIPSSSFDHIAKGGLILRAIPGKPDEWHPNESKKQERDYISEIAGLEKQMEYLEKYGAEEKMSRQARRHAERKQAPREIQLYGHTYRRTDA